jgi:hypothetical protein
MTKAKRKTIQLSATTHDRLAKLAAVDHRSISMQLEFIIASYWEHRDDGSRKLRRKLPALHAGVQS